MRKIILMIISLAISIFIYKYKDTYKIKKIQEKIIKSR